MLLFTAPRDALLAPLQSVSGIVEKRHTLPILANVLIRKTGNALQLTTSDLEIQIRTMAMDFWATIEHSLQYKYKANIPDHIRERLSAAAKAIIVLDNEMSSVRSEIMDAQNSSQIQRNLITDILNNIENLYKVTNKREVEKIQDEFYHIYAQNDLQELKRFHKELDLIAEGYRAQAITDEL